MLSPSLQKPHAIIWSRDPALAVPDDPEQRADESNEDFAKRKAEVWSEWDRKVGIARETGDWSELIRPGATPTMFYVKPMGVAFRKIADGILTGRIGDVELPAYSLRACLTEVENLGGFELKKVDEPRIGKIADEEIIAILDGIDPKIVGELGAYCWKRAEKPSPK